MKKILVGALLCSVAIVHGMDTKEKKNETKVVKNNKRLIALGKKAYKAGNLQLAKGYFKQASVYEQCQASVFEYLGRICEDRKELDEAMSYYKKIEANPSVLNSMAILYSVQGKNKEAEDCFKKAIENGSKQGICNLGLFYFKQKKFEQSEKLLVQGLKQGYRRITPILEIVCRQQGKDIVDALSNDMDDDLVSLINQLGVTYYTKEDSAMAEKCFKAAAEHGQSDALNNLGLLYYDQHKYTAAKICCKGALKQGNNDAFTNLKFIYEALDEHEALDELFKEQDKRGSAAISS